MLWAAHKHCTLESGLVGTVCASPRRILEDKSRRLLHATRSRARAYVLVRMMIPQVVGPCSRPVNRPFNRLPRGDKCHSVLSRSRGRSNRKACRRPEEVNDAWFEARGSRLARENRWG